MRFGIVQASFSFIFRVFRSYTVLKKFLLLNLFSVFFISACTAERVENKQVGEVKEIKRVFSEVIPGATPDMVTPSTISGVYEVVYGAQVIYMSKDGRYAIQGDLIDLKSRVNLTESARSAQRTKLVKKIDESSTIVFEPQKVKHTITVFTDIDCGYCRKLHREMDQYTDLGIKVRYLAFPRSGINTDSYYKAVTVWCSDDKKKAMTDAKAGVKQDRKDCENPVKDHMKLAEQFSVSGTPTIVMENGEVVPGYVPAARLSRMLDNVKTASLK